MRKRITFGMLAAVLMGMTTLTVADTDDTAELAAPDVRGVQRKIAPNEVAINGKTLFTVPVGNGALSAPERADIIRERLEEIAAHYLAGSGAVTVTPSGVDTFVVAVAGEPIATVEPRLARAVGAPDTETLARNWATAIRQNLPKARITAQVAKAKTL
ncbi:MAG: hypothetical protein H7145_07835 [Akkermansiaceae bacterium]|nr:hypothetical protein [Armatimonadota bacterium]